MSINYFDLDFGKSALPFFNLYEYSYDSPIERILGELLAKCLPNNGASVIPQVEVNTTGGDFVLDFLLITYGRKYAIECDGKNYHDHFHDLYRDGMLLGEHFVDGMIRFTGRDLTKYPHICLLFLSRIVPSLFNDQSLYALTVNARNERWDATEDYDPDGKNFYDEFFDENIEDGYGEYEYGEFGMNIIYRNNRLPNYHKSLWYRAYTWSKEHEITNWERFVKEYKSRWYEDMEQVYAAKPHKEDWHFEEDNS